MNKLFKRTLVSLLALFLVPVLMMNAFAAFWSNKGTFSGLGYSGNYSASINVTSKLATISLSVSDYIGPVHFIDGVGIKLTIYYKDGSIMDPDPLIAEDSTSHTWHIQPIDTSYEFTKIICEFFYMGNYITSRTVSAD